MASLTLLDIAKQNNTDSVAGLIEESIQMSPEAMSGAARTIAGTSYRTLIRTNVPTGAFRNANEGNATVKSTYKNKLVETFIMDISYEIDQAIADASEDGREAVLAMEASGVMEAAFRALSSQFYYGTASTFASSQAGSAAKGHIGLQSVVDSTMVLDATGTTASTGSSVWAVKWGPKDVSWVFGQGGTLATDEVRVVRVTDGSSNPYDAYRQKLLAYVGLQVASKYSIAQIKNLTEDSTKGLTDDRMFRLLELFPAGVRPDAYFMTKRSLRQLRESRTATNPTGSPAPLPMDHNGIPIIVTDGLVDTETIV